MTTTKLTLFLCTGNFYRSRYAEELFNFHARTEALGWRAFSRGLAEKKPPENIGPMSRHTLNALEKRGIEPEGAKRYPQLCSLADFGLAEFVIALKEAEHRPLLASRFPGWENRVSYWHVHDIDIADPVKAVAEMDRLVRDLIRNIKAST
jgi:protein-tyrosine phosphatase